MQASNKKMRRAASTLAAASVVAAAFLVALQKESGAQGNARAIDVCLSCHEGYDASLAGTAHRLPVGGLDAPDARVACTDCHAGDPRHYEDDPEQFPMTNPSALGALAQAQVCSTCHLNAHQQNILEHNAHMDNDVNCSGCHAVHESAHRALLKKPQTELCLSCHTGVEGQFAQPFRHPVNDEVVTCSECHSTLDVAAREVALNGTNSACMNCHAEFQGPFPYEHQATVDSSTEEGGCLTCHAAHGSNLPRMLKQPYESPHFQLCSHCHSVPVHNQNVQHGTQWAGVACNQCHTDIHGSYTNRHFLDEALQSQGCFNVGCHQF